MWGSCQKSLILYPGLPFAGEPRCKGDDGLVKVTSSEIEGSQVVLEMEIEAERLEKSIDRAYRRLASRVNIPGFRRGKAPRAILERMIGREALMEEALESSSPKPTRKPSRKAASTRWTSPSWTLSARSRCW
jgi:FKBP-type peptidyl-prolyl cis-trans isomerase (trigger factor)